MVHTVHQYCFRNIVCVVASDNVVDAQGRSASVEGLPPEYTTECTIVLLSYLRDDRVHCPAVELFVGKNFERQIVLLLISFYRLFRGYSCYLGGRYRAYIPPMNHPYNLLFLRLSRVNTDPDHSYTDRSASS